MPPPPIQNRRPGVATANTAESVRSDAARTKEALIDQITTLLGQLPKDSEFYVTVPPRMGEHGDHGEHGLGSAADLLERSVPFTLSRSAWGRDEEVAPFNPRDQTSMRYEETPAVKAQKLVSKEHLDALQGFKRGLQVYLSRHPAKAVAANNQSSFE